MPKVVVGALLLLQAKPEKFGSSTNDKVWNISEFDKEEQKTLSNVTMDSASNENWWDQVDMTKLILACNKISVISPKVIHSKLYQENKLKFVRFPTCVH